MVRLDIAEADARRLASTVQMQLIRPLVMLRHGPQALPLAPRFIIPVAAPQELNRDANRVALLARIGLRIPAKWTYRKFQIPQPEEGQAVLQPPAPQGDFGPQVGVSASAHAFLSEPPSETAERPGTCSCTSFHGGLNRRLLVGRVPLQDSAPSRGTSLGAGADQPTFHAGPVPFRRTLRRRAREGEA
jgi:hypothetical protein